MSTRIATAAVGIPLLVLAAWAGGLWFLALVAAVTAVGSLEVSAMARRRGHRPTATLAQVWAVALVAAAYVASTEGDTPAEAAALLVVVAFVGQAVVLPFALWRSRPSRAVVSWAVTAGAALYPGLLLAYAPLLRSLDDGFLWVLLLLGTVFAADTAAFIAGRLLGRRRMAPRISPGKTWEGTAAGLAAAAAACAIIAAVLDLPVSLPLAAALGAVLGVVAILGDLAESALKRACGVKDSGALVPGHGGVLDRLDSIVFSLPLMYHFIAWIVQ